MECDAENGEPKQGSKGLPAYPSTTEGSPTLLLHTGRVRGPDSVEEVGVAGGAEEKKKLHRHREASQGAPRPPQGHGTVPPTSKLI